MAFNNFITENKAFQLFNQLKTDMEKKTDLTEIAKKIPGYSTSGTLTLKLIDGVPTWVVG